jgi:hypothetical protein
VVAFRPINQLANGQRSGVSSTIDLKASSIPKLGCHLANVLRRAGAIFGQSVIASNALLVCRKGSHLRKQNAMQRRPSFQLPDFVWYPNAVAH